MFLVSSGKHVCTISPTFPNCTIRYSKVRTPYYKTTTCITKNNNLNYYMSFTIRVRGLIYIYSTYVNVRVLKYTARTTSTKYDNMY